MRTKEKDSFVGIFDSGMGGLTVAHAVSKLLPHENILYFGDTLHTPWGDKSPEAIQHYSLKICELLLQRGCKAILVACNTASAVAHEAMRAAVGDRVLLLNVIDPVVQHIAENHADQKIGLIGTKQTIRSDAYKKRIDSLIGGEVGVALSSLATPLLVPLIEEGYAQSAVTKTVIQDYLAHPSLEGIRALILGCTHYPLIKYPILDHYGHQVSVIDSAELAAKALAAMLDKQDLLRPKQTLPASHQFYISDNNPFFSSLAKLFFTESVKVERHPLWD
jgi:glutamate racemase